MGCTGYEVLGDGTGCVVMGCEVMGTARCSGV